MSLNSDIESLFDQVQESALPAVWSKGVALSREKGVIASKNATDEIIIKIQKPQNAVAPKVTLWPKEGDWFCDCGDRNDPCVHVCCAIAAVKNKTIETLKTPTKAKKGATTATKKESPAANQPPELQYRFFARSGYLYFERLLVQGTKKPIKLNQSLVSYMGGVGSGRIKEAPPPATKEDYAIDHIIGGQIQNPLDRYTLTRLLSTLKGVANVRFDEEPIEISMQTASMQAVLRDDGKDFRLELAADPTVSQAFKNGVVLSSGQLKALREPLLNPKEKSYFRKINAAEIQSFVAEVLPSLEAKMVIQVNTNRLPQLRKIVPHVILHMMAEGKNRLSVYASIVYGDPPVAELRNGVLEALSDTEVPQRDLDAENKLAKRLHQELQLQVERQAVFENESALLFASKARGWERTGNGYELFSVKGQLAADFSFENDNVNVGFNGAFTNGKAVAAKKVLEAWRHNKAFVQLDGGGWAEIPHDFLMKHGERVEALLKAKERFGEKTPKYLIPEAADLCIEAGGKLPERLTSLKDALLEHNGIPSAKLPKDLKANLRSYQKRGVDWLKFLKNLNLGGLLADDMGLGKTLQSIACIEGSVLVICPTSVLQAWSEQITEFRPNLKYTIYHGSGRSLEADVVLTTYGVFRLEQNLLSKKHWDMIVLDEAQTIKNPDSQIARAIHRLEGDFKIALSGTPVENRIDDLWSQFEFLNPGLLGTRAEFLESFSQVMRSGDPTGLENIRKKIRPFILRRLKKEVAPELPPRTEIVLHAELNKEEQDLYKAVMAASQKEVLEKLEAGNVMAALEMLLRLRQTCCHRGLVPGSDAPKTELSSKLTLLFETLEESLNQGHRALVFSQWTSLLDIVEPFMKSRGITYSRLDGSTRNRDKVVSEFQQEDGPSVMLISLKAGGVGITLTAADHIYILDPWWNPAVEDQAADRAHRIGQENPVLIHRLVAKGTVEDKILALQKKKQAIANSVLSGNADPTTISRDEILELLS